MPRLTRVERNKYGEKKKQVVLLLTDSANQILDEMADELCISRSETLERAIRAGGLELARKEGAA